jgi:ubiquinone/menaquinone biosynthesis C-methylase UbiE
MSAYQYKKPFTIISRFLNPKNIVLDWGCGNGYLSVFLVHNKQKTIAYGFGETEAPISISENSLFKFVAADISNPINLPFADNYFDIVISMGVLEHVHESGGDQIASLKEIYRILKPQGYFLCFHFPYTGSWVETIHNAIMPFKKKVYTHTKRFSHNNVINLINDSNFILKEWNVYNFLPRNISYKFPASVANNTIILYLYNILDIFLARIFYFLCNQSYFIAQKK